ncbi:356_t:CDS:2 [Funneliformis mosseae]|uniref:356_t:CDS:1 n=1 Tax=Funneliformis mosseae TaxID=27381 RepID=A0A9N8WIS9_FUNMO|nr:356_t:CDS:2 [Funneliformis mosseae]
MKNCTMIQFLYQSIAFSKLVILKATKYRKYDPSGIYIKVAQGSKSITQYFSTTENKESTDSENKDKSETSNIDSNVNAIILNANPSENINDIDRNTNINDLNIDFNSNSDEDNDNNLDIENNIEKLKKLEHILGKIQASEYATEEVYNKSSY